MIYDIVIKLNTIENILGAIKQGQQVKKVFGVNHQLNCNLSEDEDCMPWGLYLMHFVSRK